MFAITNTSAFLQAHPKIKRLINFGSCYGILDYEIARRNPGVHLYGLDRADLVRKFNDEQFRAPNLTYVAADIMEYLRGQDDLSDTAFLFMRTAFIFPEKFMAELMKVLGERRIAAIVGLEPSGYSLSEGGIYELSTNYQPSVLGRGLMYFHNYPYWAGCAGLRVVQQKWLCPVERTFDHKDAQRIYCFIAARLE